MARVFHFVDDRWPEQQWLGSISYCFKYSKLILSSSIRDFEAIVAVGNNQIRQKWQQLLLDLAIPIRLRLYIHKQSLLLRVKIGQG